MTSEGSIRIDIEDGDGGYSDDENTEPYDKLKSALSVTQDKSNGENNSDDVGNVDIEVQNCFAASIRRLESRNKDRGFRGRERGRERRGGQLQLREQRHLCSASESRVHSDEEDSLGDRGCNLNQYDYGYDDNDDDDNNVENNNNDNYNDDGEDVENDHHNININKKELLSPIVTCNNQGQLVS